MFLEARASAHRKVTRLSNRDLWAESEANRQRG